MSPPTPRRRGARTSPARADRGASYPEYIGLGVLAALIVAALVTLVGPQVAAGVQHVICEIVHVGQDGTATCPAGGKPPVAQSHVPTVGEARCVSSQRISYAEAQGYVRPRILGARGGMRWTTTTRVISHGPGEPPTYEVTVQSWKEGAVEAGIKGGDKLPVDAMAYLGLNATEGHTYAFDTKEEADAFKEKVPRYFIGGTAYDVTRTLTGPVGFGLGLLDKVTGGHVKKWAQGNPPQARQDYEEVGPTGGVDLRADIPLGADGQLSLGGKGRFWRLYGTSHDNRTGEKTYYIRQNNEIQPTVSLNLGGYASVLKGLTGKDLQAAIAKVVLDETGRAVGVPPKIAQWVVRHGAAGLTMKWKPNTQYQVTYDKDGHMSKITKVDDTIMTWYAMGSLKGGSLGGDDGSPDRNGRGRHRKPTNPKVRDPRVQGQFSIASSRTTTTSTLDTTSPGDYRTARAAMGDILLQNAINPVTPPTDDDLEQAFRDHGTMTRLQYDNDVNGGKAEGRNYGAKGLIGLEISGEDEQDHLSDAQYWDRSTASWKPWTDCR